MKEANDEYVGAHCRNFRALETSYLLPMLELRLLGKELSSCGLGLSMKSAFDDVASTISFRLSGMPSPMRKRSPAGEGFSNSKAATTALAASS
eukprot:CAMPEP_0195017186 /NCGR_PEP_ID=MMETSP0326_2-20130528/26502_1 /TAXON_ID=2866 ORGANISM="Crypthecodinium cohnii, Strain Seligo" /NCGR_SAMPLE_ID=MMETSP0326_2 /ASSEMBLY_ACC=CAM_ASM_000348 /LENGTH=92 /DNA_ID=CAMNT_0040033461 /DNA_START=93 /DNA_END=371 /DNA_ORIENTATION=+